MVLLACTSLWPQPADARPRTPWVELDCRYDSDTPNDGDSFRARCGRKQFTFRLYFVDAPETKLSDDRVEEQAKQFNVPTERVPEIGEEARRFSRGKLRNRFKVHTYFQSLGKDGEERYYAFVETKAGELGELLVRNGLARVYGTDVEPRGMRSPSRQRDRLKQLQGDAKQDKVGGWGILAGRLNRRAPSGSTKEIAESIEFFDPENFLGTESEIEISPGPSVPQGLKLDINQVTEAELVKLPGIGPVIAKRIINRRNQRRFHSADELRDIEDIGPKTYIKLRPYFK